MDTNYNIEALDYLLNKDCLPEKYAPLLSVKERLMSQSLKMGYRRKNELAALSDDEWEKLGFQDKDVINLLRRFLSLYDPRPQKMKELEKLCLSEQEKRAFWQLYHLPGVQQTRAYLYYYAGYETLESIANADEKEILEKTALTISARKLSCTVPLPKEVRTHIAVARAFTETGCDK